MSLENKVMQNNKNEPNSNSGTKDLSIKEVANEATNQSPDEIKRQMLRGDETKGSPDDRDVVGNIDSSETWQGREESKPDSK